MPIEARGKLSVPTPGTPVRVTAAEANPAETIRVHGYLFQTLPGNTGKMYIGKANLDRTTLVGVLAILAIPTTNLLPTFSAAITWSANGLMLEELYVDADVANEGVLCTVLVA